MDLPHGFLEDKSNQLIQELHEIEESLISDDRLKSAIIQSGSQLRKVFGDGGYYDQYIQGLKAKLVMSQNDILQNMISTDKKAKISPKKAITNGETIFIIKNTLLSEYLAKNNLIPRKELKDIQNIFKEGQNIMPSPLELQTLDQKKIEALEKYVVYLSDNKEFLKKNIENILNNFENPYSLNSVLGHELAHHIFRDFTKLKGNYFVALNEGYSFAIQKFLYLFDQKQITVQDVKKGIVGLYKIVGSINTSCKEEDYKFMRSFILLLGGLTIASAIEKLNSPYIDKTIINQSYNQNTYSGLFDMYDSNMEKIKNDEIKELLQQLKNTSLGQLQKCKSILIDNAINDIKGFESDDHKKFRLWAQMFVRTLDLLNYAGGENVVNAFKVAYFKKFFMLLNKIETYDDEKKAARKQLGELIYSNEFKAKEMIALIDRV